MTLILDGKKIAEKIEIDIRQQVVQMTSLPKLAVIQVGKDPASSVYVQNKLEACRRVGIESETILIDEAEAIQATKNENCLVQKEIKRLNEDSSITGILVQLPIPKELNFSKIISLIDPRKDVDGFSPNKIKEIIPCTAKGCLYLIKEAGTVIKGKQAVVIGRGYIAGEPIAQLLDEEGATVDVCDKETENLGKHTRQADILISAVGHPHLIKKDMVKKGVVIIDVGITREQNGEGQYKLTGDVDFEEVKEIASAITPVPGGVGPVTVAMLLENTLICWKIQR
ncbi:MAG: bifunctional 5,10-methylenetetrahydrofolate dehydrogenase/5,10-methenyltetrahydrofolate cyclohydrolase [Patescibacteria group bacterium]|nr:bifunctional 5,10-methylenetetrahydrofolate dehydrogenase/5,10-methenyltetrahydrofolate cyclohydrolase [Patescibacteria group bacterium]